MGYAGSNPARRTNLLNQQKIRSCLIKILWYVVSNILKGLNKRKGLQLITGQCRTPFGTNIFIVGYRARPTRSCVRSLHEKDLVGTSQLVRERKAVPDSLNN